MHLDEDMTVVENLTVSDTLGLGINYVTTINPDNSQAQMVHYCEAVAIKNEYQNVSKTLAPHLRNVPNFPTHFYSFFKFLKIHFLLKTQFCRFPQQPSL